MQINLNRAYLAHDLLRCTIRELLSDATSSASHGTNVSESLMKGWGPSHGFRKAEPSLALGTGKVSCGRVFMSVEMAR